MLLSNNERVRYEFDKTGKSQDNLVSSERHKTKNLLHRIIVPIYGAFYNTSVVLKDVKSGKIIPKTSYRFDDPSVVVAQRTGFGASHTIILTDTTVGDEIDVTYQVVGGIYGADKMNSIYDRLVDANLDNRPVDWTNITNKPAEFVPTEHLHPVDQLYGFEHLVYVMERYVQATLIGDEASHDVIWDALEKLDERVTTNHTQITAALNAHKIDFNNPHKVTLAQLGGLTVTDVDAKIKVVQDALNLHIKDKNNPHGVYPAQIGTLTSAEINALVNGAKTEAAAALKLHVDNFNNPHKVTAAQIGVFSKDEVKALVNAVTLSLNTHINNKANPHGVTAAQVGTLTTAQITSLINTTIANGVAKDLSAHIANKANPHAVTAAQVGTLTTAQINAAIKVVSDSLNSHIANKNNPHATTAAQVGTLTTAQIQAADTSILNQAKAYTDALQNKILQGNGLVKPTLIPLSATAGNELERNSDGLFFQVSTSAWAVQYGWVERLTNGNVQWRSQNNATKVSLYPSTWA